MIHRIATHKKPDVDALVSAWLMSRFYFQRQRSTVEFVQNPPSMVDGSDFCCILDVGRQYDPNKLRVVTSVARLH